MDQERTGFGWSFGRALAAAIVMLSFTPGGAVGAESARGVELFEKKVGLILETSCYTCHNPVKLQGGLDISTRERLLRGGGRGAAVIPGDAEASRLYQAITHAKEPYMPKEGDPLSEEQVALIKEWIDLGAPYTPGFFIGERAREPAAQPIANGTHDSAEANEGRSAEFQEELAALTERLRASKADIERLTELLESSESTRFETDSPLHGAGGLDAAVPVNPKIRPAKFIPRGDIPENERVKFNRDVRPILSGTCFACHGPDRKTRQAGLRLDDGIVAFTELKSGKTPIIPFDLSKSELIRRITTNDKADRMPPASFEQSLSEGQVDLLKRWVEQGAEWERHWAYIPPTQPELPPVKVEDWGKNPIDSFVLARLESEGLTPRDEASREALIRRVTLDLIGLPPTLEEVDAFTADDGPGAYERLVDNLLARPQYGEHMARYWLDASRYADTNGYHIDNERTMWPWRDWVITAFNENKPFDEFATEQLAGDLLPDPTLDQKIATGFNRNHMINFEGGAIPEEYRVNYVIDRVNTVGTVFLGMTVGCAQCHDHKYDPLSQREFYQLFSFFDKISEEGLDGRNGNSVPTVLAADPEAERRLADFADRIAKLESKRNDPMLLVDAAQSMWAEKWSEKIAERWVQLEPERAIAHGEAFLVQLSDGTTLAVGDNPDKETYEVTAEIKQENITTIRLDALVHETLDGATGRADNGSFALDEFEAWISPLDGSADPMPIKFIAAHADYAQRGFAVEKAIDANLETSWAVDGNESKEDRTALFVAERPFGFQGGSRLRVKMQFGNRRARHAIGRFRLSISTDPKLAPVEMSEWYQNGPFPAETGEEAHDTAYEPEAQPIDVEAKYADGKPKWIALPDFEDGKTQHILGDIAATYFYRAIDSPGAREMVIRTGSNDALKIWLNGEVVFDHNERRGLKKGEDRIELRLVEGENRLLAKVVNYGGSEYAFNFRKVSEELAEIPLEVDRILSVDAGDRTEDQIVRLREQFRSYFPRWRELDKELDSLRESKASFKEDIPSPMIMDVMEEPRQTFVLQRGQYDAKGEKVASLTPSALPPMPEGAAGDRLGFAKWLFDPGHPLTSRVTVNRYWQRYFGTGLVATAGDFGSQGEWPTHPGLLDWLATEFMNLGWDVKAMQKLIVMSASYRQDSRGTLELVQRDPDNRLFARGPRFRLDAEVVRDSALALSGLLVDTIGGSSVKPYQPADLWKEVAYGDGYTAQIYKADEGNGLYRRSMYTFWKRQCPPPSMIIFDAPNRELCSVRRGRTNTPLQALALMNDPQFVEASRAMAQRTLLSGGDGRDDRIQYAFRLATSRRPSDEEISILNDFLDAQLEEYGIEIKAARALIDVGESEWDETLDPSELAAWTTLTSMILNLDETITK